MSTDTNIGGGERETLAGEFALGVLSGPDRQRAERLFGVDSAFAAEVSRWQERLFPLAAGYGEIAPPAAAKRQLEGSLFGTPADAGWWNSLSLWRPLALAASLAALVLAANLYFEPDRVVAPQKPLLAALQADAGPVRYVALIDREQATITLTRLSADGAGPAEGRDHELWLIAGGRAPRSLGLMARSESSVVPLQSAVLDQIAAGAVLAVSDEPQGGSPGQGPTGPVIAAGPITSF